MPSLKNNTYYMKVNAYLSKKSVSAILVLHFILSFIDYLI